MLGPANIKKAIEEAERLSESLKLRYRCYYYLSRNVGLEAILFSTFPFISDHTESTSDPRNWSYFNWDTEITI